MHQRPATNVSSRVASRSSALKMTLNRTTVASDNTVQFLARLDHNLPSFKNQTDKRSLMVTEHKFIKRLLQSKDFTFGKVSQGNLKPHDEASLKQAIHNVASKYERNPKTRKEGDTAVHGLYKHGSDFLSEEYLARIGYQKGLALAQLRQRLSEASQAPRLACELEPAEALELQIDEEDEEDEISNTENGEEGIEVLNHSVKNRPIRNVKRSHPSASAGLSAAATSKVRAQGRTKDSRNLHEDDHSSSTSRRSIPPDSASMKRRASSDGAVPPPKRQAIDLTDPQLISSTLPSFSNANAESDQSRTIQSMVERPGRPPTDNATGSPSGPEVDGDEQLPQVLGEQVTLAMGGSHQARPGLPSVAVTDRNHDIAIYPKTLKAQVKILASKVDSAVEAFFEQVEANIPGEQGEGAVLPHPTGMLLDLYNKVMGQNWSQKSLILVDEQSFTWPALLQSLVSAYLIIKVFHRPVPWQSPLKYFEKADKTTQALLKASGKEQNLDMERTFRKIAMLQTSIAEFRRDVVQPVAKDHARSLYMTLSPQLNLICKHLDRQELKAARREFGKALEEICLKAFTLHGQMAGSDCDYEWIWAKSTTAVKLAEMVDALDKSRFEFGPNSRVVLTTFPGVKSIINPASEPTHTQVLCEALVTFMG